MTKKKSFLSFLLAFILILPFMFFMTACDGGNGDGGSGAGTGGLGGTGGGTGIGGGSQQTNWFMPEAVSDLGITGLSAPSGTYTTYYYEAMKRGGVTFDSSTTLTTIIDYVTVLFNYGFNQNYNPSTYQYTLYTSVNEALTGSDTYKTFYACKYTEGVSRIEVSAQFIETIGYNDKSITFQFYDLSTRPANTWFTESEATAMGFTGLDTFSNIANKTIENSSVMTFGNTKKYKISVSGVAKADAKVLMEYFFDNGAKISHYDESATPTILPNYTHEELFTEYTNSVAYWGLFDADDCDVNINWCQDPTDSLGNHLPENLLEIELTWNTNHTVNNH